MDEDSMVRVLIYKILTENFNFGKSYFDGSGKVWEKLNNVWLT